MEDDHDDYRRDDRAMMRASLESMGDEYWSDEDDVAPGGSVSSSSLAKGSTSSSAPVDDPDDLIDESSLLEHWNEVAEALSDPHGADGEKTDGEKYRAPIICVLGHVDTGKTSLLDKLRKSSVQAGEAGGITQQMGATYFPRESLIHQTAPVNHPDLHLDIFVPGLLILDTPGHASFSAMRNRGSSLCDMAILVIDIMHGLENQTLESIQILKKRRLPFVIALNKVDRIFEWKSEPNAPIVSSLKKQNEATTSEFNKRLNAIMDELRGVGVNPAPYYDNPDFRKHVSVCPISAVTGEGIADLLFLLIQLNQRFLKANIEKKNQFRCHVLEVRSAEGVGATVSVVLVEGTLRERDIIVVAGLDGPIVCRIRTLLLPNAGREIRDQKNAADNERSVKSVTGVIGVKIVARGLEKALAGSPIMVPSKKQNIEVLKAMVMEELDVLMKRTAKSNFGVVVHASTIGAAEALLEFLSDGGVPVRKIHIGKVTRSSVTEVAYSQGSKAYRCILAFDVKITRDAAWGANDVGIPIFSANIIYHLFDAFTAHSNKSRGNEELICPFMLQVLPDVPMSNCKPCTFGVVLHGELEVGADIGVILRNEPFGYVQIMRRLSDNMPIVRAKHGDELIITVVPREGRDKVPRIFGSFDPYMDLLGPPIFSDRRRELDQMEENRLLYSPFDVNIPYSWSVRAQDENEIALNKLISIFRSRVRESNEEWNLAQEARRIELRGRGIDAW